MDDIRSYRDLQAWQRAMDWVTRVYKCARNLPDHERYGLTSQLQRAAVSVPANIAEGHARDGTGEFLRHLSFSQGSLAEVQTLLAITVNLGHFAEQAVVELVRESDEIGRMIRGLQRSLNRRRDKR